MYSWLFNILEKNIKKLRQSIWIQNMAPDSKYHRADMGPIWGRQDPGGPHVSPMNLAIWAAQLKWH